MEQQLLLEILHKVEDNSKDLKDIKKTVNEHSKTLDEHTRILNGHSKTLEEHTIILNEHSKKLDEHSRILDEHSKQLGKHDSTLDEHSSDIKSIKRSLFIIEDAVTNKIPALFDAYQTNQEKHDEFNNRIEHVENISDTNSLKISILEDTSKKHSKQLKKLLS